jgi:hypothetical protein
MPSIVVGKKAGYPDKVLKQWGMQCGQHSAHNLPGMLGPLYQSRAVKRKGIKRRLACSGRIGTLDSREGRTREDRAER